MGVNDGDDEVDGIAALLAGKLAMMNLIPLNPVDDLAIRRPAWPRAVQMARAQPARHPDPAAPLGRAGRARRDAASCGHGARWLATRG